MGKVLQFKRTTQAVAETHPFDLKKDDIDGYISAVISDYSLTVANRHWILENLLMDIDDELEGYKKALDAAEVKLDTLVKAAEREIAAAYREFNEHVGVMTRSVHKLTGSRSPQCAATRPAYLTAVGKTTDNSQSSR